MNIFQKVYYKFKIDVLWNTTASTVVRFLGKKFEIMSAHETVNYIIDHKCSVARFGDGELHVAAYGCPLKFQRADSNLKRELNKVIRSQNSDLLLCLPNRVNITSSNERKKLPVFWQTALREHLYPWTKNFSKKRLYGDTNLSRLTEGSDIDEKIQFIQHIMQIWNERNVVMVEGHQTRFGVGNNLLDNAKTIIRLLGPAESAFDVYQELFAKCIELSATVDDPLFLIALGPTATVLASDLADNGIQAIDIGHLDISYELLTKHYENNRVYGKYTNEAEGGDIVEDSHDTKYLTEIVCYIDSNINKENSI